MENLSKDAARLISSVALAYAGDAVFSLHVRERLIKKHDFKTGKLSDLAKKYVSANGQAIIYDRLKDKLTEEEADVLRRARNAHTGTKAKNAGLSSYKKATALEAVLGFLYLTGQTERLGEIEDICFEVIEGQ